MHTYSYRAVKAVLMSDRMKTCYKAQLYNAQKAFD